MSKWTDFRDSLENSLDFGQINEAVKQNFTTQLINEVLPTAEAVADKFIGTIRDQAKTEQGWCKIRDAVVLPAAIDMCLYAMRKLLTATVNNTTK